MARYKYLGEPPPPPGIAYNFMNKIVVPTKDGPSAVYLPIAPKTTFPIGEDIGYDIADPISIVIFDADARYQKIA